MARKMKSRNTAMKMARDLKRKKKAYLTQGAIALLVSLAGALSPWIMYGVGVMDSNNWHVMIIAVIALAAGGFISSNRVQKYREVDSRLTKLCEKHALNEATIA